MPFTVPSPESKRSIAGRFCGSAARNLSVVENGWPEDEPHRAADCPTTFGVASGDRRVDYLEPLTSANAFHATISIDHENKQPRAKSVTTLGILHVYLLPIIASMRRETFRRTKYCWRYTSTWQRACRARGCTTGGYNYCDLDWPGISALWSWGETTNHRSGDVSGGSRRSVGLSSTQISPIPFLLCPFLSEERSGSGRLTRSPHSCRS